MFMSQNPTGGIFWTDFLLWCVIAKRKMVSTSGGITPAPPSRLLERLLEGCSYITLRHKELPLTEPFRFANRKARPYI